MVKPGATVIDVGMNRDDAGKLCGDVDFAGVKEVAGHITPVPGGVGPMTITMLLINTSKPPSAPPTRQPERLPVQPVCGSARRRLAGILSAATRRLHPASDPASIASLETNDWKARDAPNNVDIRRRVALRALPFSLRFIRQQTGSLMSASANTNPLLDSRACPLRRDPPGTRDARARHAAR